MADDTSASIIQLHQPKKAAPKTGAERARLYRQRKKAGASLVEAIRSEHKLGVRNQEPGGAISAPHCVAAAGGFGIEAERLTKARGASSSPKHVAVEGIQPREHPAPIAPVTPPVTSRSVTPVTPVTASRDAKAGPNVHLTRAPLASWLLTMAAFGLAGVGVTMNGWFARSLGSSDMAGWLFLAIGVAADATALAVPSCAAQLWAARQRGAALAGWLVWAMTFAFAVTAGIGFASTNIADVTLQRASRVTPAVTVARDDLADAMAARDRECAGGVGKVCRQREDAVTARRQALDAAMGAVGQTADPQTAAAVKIVAWLSGGLLKPTGDDFGMLRLVLLALLPQIGGILLMLARAPKT